MTADVDVKFTRYRLEIRKEGEMIHGNRMPDWVLAPIGPKGANPSRE